MTSKSAGSPALLAPERTGTRASRRLHAPWPKALEALRYFNETLGKMRGFNFCLANLYEDGSVGLGGLCG